MAEFRVRVRAIAEFDVVLPHGEADDEIAARSSAMDEARDYAWDYVCGQVEDGRVSFEVASVEQDGRAADG